MARVGKDEEPALMQEVIRIRYRFPLPAKMRYSLPPLNFNAAERAILSLWCRGWLRPAEDSSAEGSYALRSILRLSVEDVACELLGMAGCLLRCQVRTHGREG
jgi:hypothetical protein